MSILHPFCALRPSSANAPQVAAVPYDVVNRSEAKALASNNPLSFLHVSRPEIDLPEGQSPYSDTVYKKAKENFERLIREAPLHYDEQPSLYLYRLQMGNHAQTGIVGCFSIDEYDGNLIKKHEKTRPDKEDDRTRHILELSSQTGPAYLAYRDSNRIQGEIEKIQSTTAPITDFVSNDQVGHRIWKVPAPQTLVGLFASEISCLYIADGHHRAAAASRVRSQLRDRNPAHRGSEEYNFVLAAAFPASQLQILPYHRVIKNLGSLSEAEFLNKVKMNFEMLPLNGDGSSIPVQGEFGLFFAGKWSRIRPRNSPKDLLDVDLLQKTLLEPILGIQDPRTDSRIDFVGGIRGTSELERLVRGGEAQLALSLHPTGLQQVMDVADQGGIMPPKSTWFEPKLKDGLFCHRLT